MTWLAGAILLAGLGGISTSRRSRGSASQFDSLSVAVGPSAKPSDLPMTLSDWWKMLELMGDEGFEGHPSAVLAALGIEILDLRVFLSPDLGTWWAFHPNNPGAMRPPFAVPVETVYETLAAWVANATDVHELRDLMNAAERHSLGYSAAGFRYERGSTPRRSVSAYVRPHDVPLFGSGRSPHPSLSQNTWRRVGQSTHRKVTVRPKSAPAGWPRERWRAFSWDDTHALVADHPSWRVVPWDQLEVIEAWDGERWVLGPFFGDD